VGRCLRARRTSVPRGCVTRPAKLPPGDIARPVPRAGSSRSSLRWRLEALLSIGSLPRAGAGRRERARNSWRPRENGRTRWRGHYRSWSSANQRTACQAWRLKSLPGPARIAFGACGSAKIARNSGGDLCWRRAQVVRHRGGRIDEGQRRWRARSMHKKRLSMRSAVFAIIFLANQTGAGDPTARTQRRRAHRSRSRSGARSQRGRARKVAATVCRAGPGR